MILSVVIPAFNEAKTLKDNVYNFGSYLSQQPYDYEIIIVNDGSTDDTKNQALALASSSQKIKLIENKKNLGKGAAIKRGMLSAQGDFCLFIDADGATSIDHLALAWPLMQTNNDIIIGTRNKKDANGACQKIPQALWKRILGTIGNYVIRSVAVKNIRDTQCGFKILSRKAINDIIPRTRINRWAVDVEILVLASKLNYKIAQVPVHWENRPYSRVGIKGYLLTFFEVGKIKLNLLTNKYNLTK
jgi:dolichyl-phosphate beta-glucosyltransferase